jgi:hypothetical protein
MAQILPESVSLLTAITEQTRGKEGGDRAPASTARRAFHLCAPSSHATADDAALAAALARYCRRRGRGGERVRRLAPPRGGVNAVVRTVVILIVVIVVVVIIVIRVNNNKECLIISSFCVVCSVNRGRCA